MKKDDLPKKLAVFPLSNFIIFPKTSVPLNIFEPRYIDMINDSMKTNKLIGIIQPKISKENIYDFSPPLHQIGCMGKITTFKETEDSRFIIELKGIIRFEVIKEIQSNKKYRECEINFSNFFEDLENKKEDIKFSDLELIFKNLKSLFKKQGYVINWKDIEKQSLDQTINTLSMASPFSLEEKQILLETPNINNRKQKLEEILQTYLLDDFSNTTLQ